MASTLTEAALLDILRRVRATYYNSPRKSAATWQEIAQKMFEIANEALAVDSLPKPVDQSSFEERLNMLPSASKAIESAKMVVITPTPLGGVHLSWANKSAAVEFSADGEIISIWWEKPRE